MHHSRPADLVISRVSVSLQNAFELSQEPLRSIPSRTLPATKAELKRSAACQMVFEADHSLYRWATRLSACRVKCGCLVGSDSSPIATVVLKSRHRGTTFRSLFSASKLLLALFQQSESGPAC